MNFLKYRGISNDAAYDKECAYGKWIFGALAEKWGDLYITDEDGDEFKVDKDTVGIFIGTFNSGDVYTHDIAKVQVLDKSGNLISFNAEIIYDEEKYKFTLKDTDYELSDCIHLNVIGNSIENPRFLNCSRTFTVNVKTVNQYKITIDESKLPDDVIPCFENSVRKLDKKDKIKDLAKHIGSLAFNDADYFYDGIGYIQKDNETKGHVAVDGIRIHTDFEEEQIIKIEE